jgi:Tfp pilus assembly protein PilO
VKRQVPLTPVIAAILLVVAVVAYFLLIHPKRGEIARLSDDIETLENDIRVATINAKKGEPAVRIRVADLFALAKAMPDEDDMAGVLLELNAVATAAGIKFFAIVPQPAARNEGFVALPIGLKFVGNYYDLSDFLFRVRNLVTVRDGRLAARGRLFTLDLLTFQEGPGGFPNIEANLTLSAYVYGANATATPVSSSPPTTTTTSTTTTAPTGGTP